MIVSFKRKEGVAFDAVAGAVSFLIYKFVLGLDLFICALIITNLFKVISGILVGKKHEVGYGT